jgi:hypothetical protein
MVKHPKNDDDDDDVPSLGLGLSFWLTRRGTNPRYFTTHDTIVEISTLHVEVLHQHMKTLPTLLTENEKDHIKHKLVSMH